MSSRRRQEYGQFGGEPYGCLVGDYHFDHSPRDVEILGEMSKVAAAAHAPFLTGADPSLMQMESWSELATPRDLTKIFQTPEYAAWRSLRESEEYGIGRRELMIGSLVVSATERNARPGCPSE